MYVTILSYVKIYASEGCKENRGKITVKSWLEIRLGYRGGPRCLKVEKIFIQIILKALYTVC